MRDLLVGRVVAVLASDERVLTRLGRGQVVPALAAAHHPRLGLHGVHLEAAALEDPVVRIGVQAEALVEPLLVAVEGVRVLHDELADADQAGTRPRLVPLLRLEVVEHLRELSIRLDLSSVETDGLLVRHGQDELAPVAVLQLEDLRDVVPARRLPQLRRRQDRHQHLLGADRIHLLADDLNDLLVHPPAQGQERPDACADLTDERAPDEELVARRLGVRGVVAQGRQEELGGAPHHPLETNRAESPKPRPWRAPRAWPSSSASAGACLPRSTRRSR